MQNIIGEIWANHMSKGEMLQYCIDKQSQPFY